MSAPLFVRAAQGVLEAKVVILDELKPVPVAYTDFDLIGPDPSNVQSIRTTADGKLNLRLEPGLYAIASHEPVPFKGRTYSWSTSFEIEENRTTALTLTHSDATIEHSKLPSLPSESAETRIYHKYQYSVVTVECDSGRGSAFVIDPERGLLMTSFGVAGNSKFLSVRFARQQHFEARFVAGDPAKDIAIIRVNPEHLRSITAIPLKSSRRVGMEGEHVVAMGSPLFQPTTITEGILSKVDDDTIISDVNLSQGMAGGPILNLQGEAIGIATYGKALMPGDAGATGIVNMTQALALTKNLGRLSNDTLPPATNLPDNSHVLIPPSMLEQVAQSIKGPEFYFKAPKNFRTYLKTPFDAYRNVTRHKDFLRDRIARRYKGQVPADQNLEMGPLFFWNKYVGSQFEPVVSIEAVPWPQETKGSFLTRVAAVVAGQHRREQRELRDDFAKMALYRNGVEVQPILRKRIRDTEIYDTVDVVMRDTALSGLYTYSPDAFTPGSKLELRIWKNADERPTVIRIPEKEQDRIWNQFRDWSRLGG